VFGEFPPIQDAAPQGSGLNEGLCSRYHALVMSGAVEEPTGVRDWRRASEVPVPHDGEKGQRQQGRGPAGRSPLDWRKSPSVMRPRRATGGVGRNGGGAAITTAAASGSNRPHLPTTGCPFHPAQERLDLLSRG